MSALVFGATGLTGRHVTERLSKQGVSVTAHIRPDSSQLSVWKPRFEAMGAKVSTAAWTNEAIEALVKETEPSEVFALLGTTQARVKQAAREGRDASKETYEAVDVGLTEMILRACIRSETKPRLVYLSSVGSGENASGAYLQALKKSGVPYTIARPSFIVGERADARPAEKLVPLANGLLSMLGALGAKKTRDRYRSITGDELAQALVRVSTDPASSNRILESEDIQAILRSV
jgi:nucleoside-diphosphate-sugar epimerase